MRLLILTPEYDQIGGGIATFYRALAPSLLEEGIEIYVVEGSAFHAADGCNAHLCDGVHVETLERSRLGRWWDRFPTFAATPALRNHLAAAWAMWEQAERGKDYDIIEACDWGLLFVPPAIEAARPLVVQCHGSVGQIAVHDPIAGEATQSAIVRLIERAILTNANVQTLSRGNASFWRTETGRAPTVIYPGWAPIVPLTPSYPGDRGLVIGRVQRWKGPQTLCAALAQLGSRAPVVDWIGQDTAWGAREFSTINQLAKVFPEIWGERIVHHQTRVSEQVKQQLQSVALFNLVPSMWDVFNSTTIEGMASGRPTIVSTGAGASELIEDGQNGYLFAPGDPGSLAAVLDRVLAENPARLIKIGRAAQETVRAELEPHAITGRRLAAYRAIIESFRDHPPSPATGWLGDICRPAEQRQDEEMAFLDHLPLRSIASYALKRTRDKAKSKIVSRTVRR